MIGVMVSHCVIMLVMMIE